MTSNWKWLAAGAVVVAVAGTAALAGTMHQMTIRLPGGGTETIAYSGDVAPKVSFLTPDMVRDRESAQGFSPFAEMDRVSAMMDAMAADMDRQMQVNLLRAQQMQRSGMTDAALQAMPAGTQSYSVTTISTGNGVCTREVHITSTGAGMKPQMVSNSSGCGDNAAPTVDAPRPTAIKALIDANPGPRKRI